VRKTGLDKVSNNSIDSNLISNFPLRTKEDDNQTDIFEWQRCDNKCRFTIGGFDVIAPPQKRQCQFAVANLQIEQEVDYG